MSKEKSFLYIANSSSFKIGKLKTGMNLNIAWFLFRCFHKNFMFLAHCHKTLFSTFFPLKSSFKLSFYFIVNHTLNHYFSELSKDGLKHIFFDRACWELGKFLTKKRLASLITIRYFNFNASVFIFSFCILKNIFRKIYTFFEL